MSGKRFGISYGSFNRALLTVLGMGPERSHVTVSDDTVTVRMGWAFRSDIPRTAVTSSRLDDDKIWGWGVHGWGAKWLVNGSSSGVVRLDLDPAVPSKVGPFGVGLRVLRVSVEEPNALVAELAADG